MIINGSSSPANLVAQLQLVRGAHFPEMECWEPSAIYLKTQIEGHLGGSGVDRRQLISGKGGVKNLYLKVVFHQHQKNTRLNALEGWLCWRTNTITEDCQ